MRAGSELHVPARLDPQSSPVGHPGDSDGHRTAVEGGKVGAAARVDPARHRSRGDPGGADLGDRDRQGHITSYPARRRAGRDLVDDHTKVGAAADRTLEGHRHLGHVAHLGPLGDPAERGATHRLPIDLDGHGGRQRMAAVSRDVQLERVERERLRGAHADPRASPAAERGGPRGGGVAVHRTGRARFGVALKPAGRRRFGRTRGAEYPVEQVIRCCVAEARGAADGEVPAAGEIERAVEASFVVLARPVVGRDAQAGHDEVERQVNAAAAGPGEQVERHAHGL